MFHLVRLFATARRQVSQLSEAIAPEAVDLEFFSFVSNPCQWYVCCSLPVLAAARMVQSGVTFFLSPALNRVSDRV